jgi:hypothetical protein
MKTGDHGTFTLGDSKIVGTVVRANGSFTEVQVDGAEEGTYTSLWNEDGWTFAPDSKLPTKDDQVGWESTRVPKTKEEKMIDHDPEFPFVVLNTSDDEPFAKFTTRHHAEVFAPGYRDRIVDTTPKPLPTEPGIYVRGNENLASETTCLYSLSHEGGWASDRRGEWRYIKESEVPTDLVPLVKGTR